MQIFYLPFPFHGLWQQLGLVGAHNRECFPFCRPYATRIQISGGHNIGIMSTFSFNKSYISGVNLDQWGPQYRYQTLGATQGRTHPTSWGVDRPTWLNFFLRRCSSLSPSKAEFFFIIFETFSGKKINIIGIRTFNLLFIVKLGKIN